MVNASETNVHLSPVSNVLITKKSFLLLLGEGRCVGQNGRNSAVERMSLVGDYFLEFETYHVILHYWTGDFVARFR